MSLFCIYALTSLYFPVYLRFRLSEFEYDTSLEKGESSAKQEEVTPLHVQGIWQAANDLETLPLGTERGTETGATQPPRLPDYNLCFQGF